MPEFLSLAMVLDLRNDVFNMQCLSMHYSGIKIDKIIDLDYQSLLLNYRIVNEFANEKIAYL
jgi:hypothetical protein